MKLYSWNINGLRAGLKKGALLGFIEEYKPDVLCLQEIKISLTQKEKEAISFSGYKEFWHSAQRPGYSGTVTLVKDDWEVQSYFVDDFNDEGRLQVLEFSDFYLLNIYFPNSRDDLQRLHLKREFNKYFLSLVKKLEKKKVVISTGDFNVAHREIDLARPKENLGHAGFTLEEREDFSGFINFGLIDSFRQLNGDKIKYSWWSFRGGARQRNVGWRIDYFLVSSKIKLKLKKADILDQVKGSDHCPIFLQL